MRRVAYLSIGAGLVVLWLLASGVASRYELPARDVALRLLPPAPALRTAVVVIDESSLRAEGPWPWPRETLGRLVDRIGESNARLIALDILLSDSRPGDEILARALSRMPSVLLVARDDNGSWMMPNATLAESGALAHASFELDHDGVVRRVASTKQSDGHSYPALAAFAARAINDQPLAIGRSLVPTFRARPRSIPVVNAWRLLRSGPDVSLRGKVVLVGLTAPALGDRVLTPVSSAGVADAGVVVHAAATEAIARGDLSSALPPWIAALVSSGIVIPIMRARRFPRGKRIAIMAVVVSAPVFAAVALLIAAGIDAPIITWAAVALVASVASEGGSAVRAVRRSRMAAERIAVGLGVGLPGGLGLEELATRIARHRADEIEARRVLAHELKTPLASVRNLTQLLAGYDLTDDEKRRVTTLLDREADKLQSMVIGLLDLERLSLRDFASTSGVIDLSALVHARVAFLLRGTPRAIHTEIGDGIRIRGDAPLLERVIDNLVSNALKFSPDDSDVGVRLSGMGDAVWLEVIDTGRGIAPEERETVFRRFTRGRSARGTEGLGLGLALVAQVAEWHGAIATVNETPGGGSTFRVGFPAVRGAEEREVPKLSCSGAI